MSKEWHQVNAFGKKTLYREDDLGHCQIHFNDKKTGITLTEATVNDANFIVNCFFNTTLKEDLKKEIFKNKEERCRKAALNRIIDKIEGMEEDSYNLFFIIKFHKNKIGFVEIAGSPEESSFANVMFHFLDSKKRNLHLKDVLKTLKTICKKYNLFDLLFFYDEVLEKARIIYKHSQLPDGEIIILNEDEN